MTRNRTAKTSFKRTLIVATGMIGMAWVSNAHADDASRNACVEQTASVQSTASANSEQSFDLRDHGDRFKLAIEAIKNEAQRPEWTWDASDKDGCVARKD